MSRKAGHPYRVTLEDGRVVTIRAANADTAMMIASQEYGCRVWSVHP